MPTHHQRQAWYDPQHKEAYTHTHTHTGMVKSIMSSRRVNISTYTSWSALETMHTQKRSHNQRQVATRKKGFDFGVDSNAVAVMMSSEKYSMARGNSIVPRPFVHNNCVFDDTMHTVHWQMSLSFFSFDCTHRILNLFFLHNNNNNTSIISILLLLCQPFSPQRQQHSLSLSWTFLLSLHCVYGESPLEMLMQSTFHNVYLNLNVTHPFCFDMLLWHESIHARS